MARHQTRSRSTHDQFFLFPENVSLGWRIIRRIRKAEGEARVTDGLARKVYDDVGNHIGYQVCEAPQAKPADRRSCPVISRAEMEAIWGTIGFAEGQTRTARLDEEAKLSRIERGFAAEDVVEAALGKLAAWPSLSGEGAWSEKRWGLQARKSKRGPCREQTT